MCDYKGTRSLNINTLVTIINKSYNNSESIQSPLNIDTKNKRGLYQKRINNNSLGGDTYGIKYRNA